MIFRFIAALGIGGEWAVGASLLSETWPRAWRPWIAAVLQTGVNLGILLGAALVYLLTMILPPNGERRHFVRGKLNRNEIGFLEVSPIAETDSNHSSSLAEADALIIQPENDAGTPAGEIVEIIPLSLLS